MSLPHLFPTASHSAFLRKKEPRGWVWVNEERNITVVPYLISLSGFYCGVGKSTAAAELVRAKWFQKFFADCVLVDGTSDLSRGLGRDSMPAYLETPTVLPDETSARIHSAMRAGFIMGMWLQGIRMAVSKMMDSAIASPENEGRRLNVAVITTRWMPRATIAFGLAYPRTNYTACPKEMSLGFAHFESFAREAEESLYGDVHRVISVAVDTAMEGRRDEIREWMVARGRADCDKWSDPEAFDRAFPEALVAYCAQPTLTFVVDRGTIADGILWERGPTDDFLAVMPGPKRTGFVNELNQEIRKVVLTSERRGKKRPIDACTK